MRFPIPANTSVDERLKMFERYLDDKYHKTDAELERQSHCAERRPVLKAERAEVAIVQDTFRALFERELRRP